MGPYLFNSTFGENLLRSLNGNSWARAKDLNSKLINIQDRIARLIMEKYPAYFIEAELNEEDVMDVVLKILEDFSPKQNPNP